MKYALAKELKEAGFNPKYDGYGYWYSSGDGEQTYRPTLSELIKACGADFYKLVKEDGSWYAYDLAMQNDHYGTTPEEAVGRLWLALQKERAS